MTKQDKRTPCFEDTDMMPFGKYGPYEGDPRRLQDVPAKYLAWMKDALVKDGFNINPKKDHFDTMLKWQQDKHKLYNYIFNCQDALQMELGEKE